MSLTEWLLVLAIFIFTGPIAAVSITLWWGRRNKSKGERTNLRKLPKYNCKKNKKILYGKQKGYCNGCKTHFKLRNLEVDHIIAKSVGGTDHIDNLQLLCGYCNRVKGDRGQEYLIAKLAK